MDRHQSSTDSGDVDVEVDRAWRDNRRHLLNIAFRMLANLGEAEEAVQEAFARLVRADRSQIDDIGGWLVVVVSRVCLDRLRSDRRHPRFPVPSVGDRPLDGVDPADRVTLDDNVRIALHVVLERLSPAERTVFVLHDVFQYTFDGIAEIVGRTPAACRQLASRARRSITADAGPARFHVEPAEQRRVTDRFVAACTTGDLDGLLAVLDPDVAGEADLGHGVIRSGAGRDQVAPLLLQFLGPDSSTTLLSAPAGHRPTLVALRTGQIVALITLAVHGDRIDHVDALVDPAKLAPVAEALGIHQVHTVAEHGD